MNAHIRNRLYKKERMSCRPNIIPILDAVFIFIFFLLMSAQFIKYFVIHSDAPSVKMVSSSGNNQKTPLNLALDILPDKIIIKTHAEGRINTELKLRNGDYDWEKLVNVIKNLKQKNMDENSIILRPYDKLPYKKVIKIIDVIRQVPKNSLPIIGKNTKGESIKTKKLFDRVIFENDA